MDEEIYLKKKCAVCGTVNLYFSDKEKKAQIEYYAPDADGARAFYLLWHDAVEECPECRYVSEDISKADEHTKELVLSQEYKNLFTIEEVEEISEFEENDATSHLAYAVLNEHKDKFKSATGFLRAFFNVRQGANFWLKEVGGFDGIDNEEKRVYASALALSAQYLEKAKSKLMTIFKENPLNVEALFLLIYTYYYLREKEKAQTLVKKITELKLNTIQTKILKYLHGLVFFDRFDWE